MISKVLGSFQVKGNQLIVSDPCYPIECATDDDLSWILTPAKSGEWKARIFYEEDKTVAKLMACHIEAKQDLEWIEIGKEIAVDSAQAGIFDASIYGRDEMITYEVQNVYDIDMDEEGLKYYVACCDKVATDDQGGVLIGGTVSMSGLGDGYYPVSVQYNEKDEIVAVLLDFYGEDEEL
ncbi:DUF4241 domain-containing protein [Neobacillus niacini]|uniref:DUF4241 domain-containing protein n=1 Tax=Neobacillus niacini TaxID=86668 RepID=UPI0005ED558C|nr:DUF4241 domain-containing protein [Neobacillus niacini]